LATPELMPEANVKMDDLPAYPSKARSEVAVAG
jgi:hypothetical protein